MLALLPFRPLAAPFAVSLLFASGASAQSELILSLSGSGDLAGQQVGDAEIVCMPSGGPARPFLNERTLALLLGDRNGDGLLDVPNGIDALEFVRPGWGNPMAAGVYFSLPSDQSGLRDGDVVRFDPAAGPGGVEIVFTEAQVAAAAQANDGNIDVDAMAFLPDGTLLFSLAEDESVGPTAVTLQDDAVLSWAPGAATATVLFDGPQVAAMVQQALGSSASIGDVLSLEWIAGDVLFTVQSPTAHDASVFTSAGGGALLQGFGESQLGFANGVEADALAEYDGAPFPVIALSAAAPATGSPFTVTVSGLTPNQPFALLVANAVAPGLASMALPGFGTLALDPGDGLFQIWAANIGGLTAVSDPFGGGAFAAVAPDPAGMPQDIALQAFDFATYRISTPVIVEVNQ